MRSRFVALVAVCVLASIVPVQAAEWQPLGETIVDFRTNEKEITATDTATAFSKLRLKVLDTQLEFTSLQIQFTNGQTAEVAFKKYVGAGRYSPVVEVPNQGAGIAKISFSFKNNTARSRLARVQLFGAN